MEQALVIRHDDSFGIETDQQSDITLNDPGFDIWLEDLASTLKTKLSYTEGMLEKVNNVFNVVVDTSNSIEVYKMKEKEWHKLVGKKNFQSLDEELRDFLINAAGMFDLGFPVDIKKAYKYSIFDNES